MIGEPCAIGVEVSVTGRGVPDGRAAEVGMALGISVCAAATPVGLTVDVGMKPLHDANTTTTSDKGIIALPMIFTWSLLLSLCGGDNNPALACGRSPSGETRDLLPPNVL